MNLRLIITGIGALVAAYLAGRFSAPEKISESSSMSSLVRENEQLRSELAETKEKLTLSEKSKTRTEHYRPDGSLRTVRVKTEAKRSSSEKSQSNKVSNLIASKESVVETETTKVTESRRGVSVSALVGVPLDSLAKGIVWGASFQKPFIGPLILGAWAFTDLRFGLSVGVEL